jgi:D-alanyl-D-alanine carboxypeptidase
MRKYAHSIFIAAGVLLGCFLAFRIGTLFVKTPGNVAVSSSGEPVLAAPGTLGGNGGTAATASAGQGVFNRVASTPAPTLHAHAALIADPTSGETLYAWNAGMRWPIASLTKLMSATVIRENMSMATMVTLEPRDFEGGGNALTAALQPGNTYRADELLKIMLISSSNEAANAFARVYGEDRFIAAMNAKAAAWNLPNTNFADPSGLSIGNQSTPNEFKTLVMQVWKLHPEIFATTRITRAVVTEWNSGVSQAFENTNQFAGRADFLGGKTGTTPEAGENLVTLFSYRSHPVMILMFGSEDRFIDTDRLFTWFTHDFSPSD